MLSLTELRTLLSISVIMPMRVLITRMIQHNGGCKILVLSSFGCLRVSSGPIKGAILAAKDLDTYVHFTSIISSSHQPNLSWDFKVLGSRSNLGGG